MRRAARRLANQITKIAAQKTPLWLFERVVGPERIGFFYHAVCGETLSHVRHLYSYKSAAAFEEDIKYLKQHYDLLPMERLLGSGEHTARAERRAFFVSFDDGLRECFDYALPILRKHEVPAIFFINSGFVDNKDMCYRHKVSLCIESLRETESVERRQMLNVLGETSKRRFADEDEFVAWVKDLSFADEETLDMICDVCGVDVAGFLEERKPYMTREQIKTLANEGHIIGGHTVHHPRLGGLADVNQIEAEIVDSCKFVAEIAKTDRVPFAFPFSGRNLDIAVVESIRERHPVVGEVFDSRGVREDKGFVHNRICADRPSPVNGRSNIPVLIEQAYRDELNDCLVRARRKILRNT